MIWFCWRGAEGLGGVGLIYEKCEVRFYLLIGMYRGKNG